MLAVVNTSFSRNQWRRAYAPASQKSARDEKTQSGSQAMKKASHGSNAAGLVNNSFGIVAITGEGS